MYIIEQTNNVNEGGQFSAYLASNPTDILTTYCIDYLNADLAEYPVNVTVPTSLAALANTRYGTTATANFSYFNTAATGNLDALERYVMAAWLTTQFDFSSGVTTADSQIVNAMWTLLTVNGNGFPFGDVDGVGTYISQAMNFINTTPTPALVAFENSIRIYTSTDVGANSDLSLESGSRYFVGTQEMIGTVPEPGTIAMLGIGLLSVGLLRLRVKKA
jgi:hypothetical protein